MTAIGYHDRAYMSRADAMSLTDDLRHRIRNEVGFDAGARGPTTGKAEPAT